MIETLDTYTEFTSLYKWVRVKGRAFYLMFDTKILRNTSGQIQGVIGIMRNTTERKKNEEKMLLAQKQASLGQLAASIAHEIRNPLTSAIGFLKLMLRSENSTEKAHSYVEMVYSELKRIQDLVTEFLVLTKPSEFRTTPVDFSKLLVMF